MPAQSDHVLGRDGRHPRGPGRRAENLFDELLSRHVLAIPEQREA
jgi:hypothetical protein